jgi:hypothetical protein
MLAEAFEREVKIFCKSPESVPKLPSKLDLLALYRKFIESKYDIFQEEKLQVRKTNVIAQERRESDLKIIIEDHKLPALKVVFDKETVALFQDNGQCVFSDEALIRIGILQISHDGKPHFIHRTFAEYFVADLFVNRLTEGINTSEQAQTFIMKDILTKGEYQVIRAFIDGLLSRSNPSEEVLKQCGNRVHGLGDDCLLTVYRAVWDRNCNIVEILLDSLQAAQHTDMLVQLLLAEDYDGKTITLSIKEYGKLKQLEKIWNWANKKLKTKEINNKLLLLAKGYMGKTVFHMAAEWGSLGILETVWKCANEKLTREEIKDKLLLAKCRKGKTVFHMAANKGRQEILQKLQEWANERLTTEEINNNLL